MRAGYLDAATDVRELGEGSITGRFPGSVYDALMIDPRFANGELHKLHKEMGFDLQDFRSYRNTFGNGSLQIVINRQTGAFYADVDGWNPYQDVVNILGHTFGEVVPHWFARVILRRK